MKLKSIIEVKSAFIHQALTWPGHFSGEKTLTQEKRRGIKMLLIDDIGLLLEDKGEFCIVPSTNIINSVIEGNPFAAEIIEEPIPVVEMMVNKSKKT